MCLASVLMFVVSWSIFLFSFTSMYGVVYEDQLTKYLLPLPALDTRCIVHIASSPGPTHLASFPGSPRPQRESLGTRLAPPTFLCYSGRLGRSWEQGYCSHCYSIVAMVTLSLYSS